LELGDKVMKRDFKTWMLLLVFGLPVFLAGFIGILYVANCGFDSDCSQAGLPDVLHTPIPTLIPVPISVRNTPIPMGVDAKCLVTARTLLHAWVSSGYPEKSLFQFTDQNGASCEATFTVDVIPLFTDGNLWYSGSMSCSFCHHAVIDKAAARMDLSSYAGILSGSQRASQEVNGNDILGGGDWEKSLLNQKLFVLKEMPLGHPASAFPDDGPTILAGRPIPQK
jgi:hypothetical protein